MITELLTGLTIGLHVGSVHLPSAPDQNNFNPGLYVRTHEGWTGGFYRNTLGRTSMYAGKTFTLTSWVDFTLGGVTGYDKRYVRGECRPGFKDDPTNPCMVPQGSSNTKITIMAAPSVHFGLVRFSYIPRIGSTGTNVLHLSIEKTF